LKPVLQPNVNLTRKLDLLSYVYNKAR